MIFEQLFEPDTNTFTYIVGCPRTKEAAIIDPVIQTLDRDLEVLRKHGLTLKWVLDTHVHADHVTAADALRQATGAQSVLSSAVDVACVSRSVADGEVIEVGDVRIEARHTPGHTNGCMSLYADDRVFTGDALLINGCGRTDFQEGDAGVLYDSIHNKLFSLPDDTLVFPGHDYNGNTQSTIGQEKAHNKRLGGGRPREDFIELMNNLNLPYPRYIDEALPANKACGSSHAPQG